MRERPKGRWIVRHLLNHCVVAPSRPVQERLLAPMERLGGGLFAADVEFDDRPEKARRSGHYHAVSADSVLAFLARLDPRHRRQGGRARLKPPCS